MLNLLLKQYTATNFSKLSSFRLMRLSDRTSLNTENNPSTSQIVTGAYLGKKLGQSEPILNFIAVSKKCFFIFLFFQLFGHNLVTGKSEG